MTGARLVIDEPTVLTQVVTLVDRLGLDQADADTKGDLFEHVLRQIKQAGELGQFRTPRHIIRAIVAMIDPKIGESIYDPAAGTAGFLVAAYNHIRLEHSSKGTIQDVEIDGKRQRRGLGDKLSTAQVAVLQNKTFYGNDVDPKMVRLATMSLTLRGLLIKDLGGGLLSEHLGPLSKRLTDLTRHRRLHLGEAASRLRFPALAARVAGPAFQSAAAATLQREKVWFEYHARSTDEHSERTVSPQRVTHYRDSWYLDAWDEDKCALRSFAVDRIGRLTPLNQPAIDIADEELEAHYASSYGIFGGRADKVAILRFTKERARWVADEVWHPEQQAKFLEDGSYELRIPYGNSRELVMDILRHGPAVRVVDPESLIEEVTAELAATMARYHADH
jgi:predicted DNA-binding transcriptional regulator YafY/ribosomal protein S18 acetylase RimI-like enzyme